jgi:hypothetical protein
MGFLGDLKNAPKRKPSSERAREDREIFRAARDRYHQKLAEGATETPEDRSFRQSVDWGDIEFDDG